MGLRKKRWLCMNQFLLHCYWWKVKGVTKLWEKSIFMQMGLFVQKLMNWCFQRRFHLKGSQKLPWGKRFEKSQIVFRPHFCLPIFPQHIISLQLFCASQTYLHNYFCAKVFAFVQSCSEKEANPCSLAVPYAILQSS